MAWPRWRLVELSAAAEHAANLAAWDDLWRRSTAQLPTGQAEQLLIWQRHFAPRARMYAMVVEHDDRWVAALPLVPDAMARVLPVYKMPWSEWGFACEFLVDWQAYDLPTVMDHLVLGLQSLRRPLVWLNCVPLNSPAWQQLLAALVRRECVFDISPRFEIGQVAIHTPEAPADFAVYQTSWSGNFRRQMRKSLRRADELGGVTLRVERPQTESEVDKLFHQGFEVEDRSWKGTEGTSLLKQPAMYAFFQEQARQLARAGHLELVFLDHGGQPIAFEYGYFSKGTYFTPKVGYDERFGHLSPSQLLRYLLIERFYTDPTRQVFDFLGPLAEATAKWTTNTYPVSRLLVSTGRCGGNALLRTAQRLAPRARALRETIRAWRPRRADSKTVQPSVAENAESTARDAVAAG